MIQNQEWRRDEFFISNDHEKLDIETIHHFLTTETYWAGNRSLEIVRRSFQNSLPFVIYKNGETVGFARVVSDFATFAWLADVFIRQEYRGLGLSKWLMETIIAHPDLKDLRRFLLATKDAHGLYRQFGFNDLRIPYLWMERTAPNAYASFGIEVQQTEN
ncbi:MAG: GNAT family N-acetyltransferase [Acidobacteriota bacterium]|nr:GNAT family N-acetyltransferase [Acidobacteriota bacterium]